jgi:hypothetical protein
MLFSRLQSEAVRRLSIRVDRLPNQSTWQGSFVGIFGCQESGMRATKSERNAKSLRVADNHIGTKLSRWFQER